MRPYTQRVKKLTLWMALLFCSSALLATLCATQVIPSKIETIDDLFSRTPIAIEGEVVGHHDVFDEQVGALAVWQIKVMEVFKDTTKSVHAGSMIEFQTMGYPKADTSFLNIADVGPPIHDGMCAILFLQRSQEGSFQLFELRTTGFFEVDGNIVRRAVVNRFLPEEMSADSLFNCFRGVKSATETDVKNK
jgi:hypothetical protein